MIQDLTPIRLNRNTPKEGGFSYGGLGRKAGDVFDVVDVDLAVPVMVQHRCGCFLCGVSHFGHKS